MDLLAGVDAKLDRGFQHLEELEPKVRAFLDRKPWRITIEPDPEPPDSLPGWRLAVFRLEHEPPIDWSVRAGEAIGQFYSSLDHLMTELVILHRPQLRSRPDRTPNFPVFPSPGEFWRKPPEGGSIPADRCRRWVRAEHFAELQRLQPRKPEDVEGSRPRMPEAVDLAAMRWLNNLNKHAVVAPALFQPSEVRVHEYPNVADYRPLWRELDPLHNQTKLYRARWELHPDVGMPMTITEPNVSFGWPPFDWVPLGAIRSGGETVRKIIRRFREITPEFGA